MSKAVRVMMSTAVLALGAFYLTVPCFAQGTADQSQAAAPQNTQAAAGSAQQSGVAPLPVLKVKTRMVVIDVVAQDSKGKPISDLKKEDLTVLEDGKPQSLRIFNFQHPESAPAGQPQLPVNPPNVVDNLPHFQSGHALNVILMDSLNTSPMNQAFMRDSMIKFLEKLPENEPIAVFLLGDKLRLVQDFTTDPTALKQVIRSFKGKKSPYLNGGGPDVAAAMPGMAQILPQMAVQIKEFQDQITGMADDIRVKMTLTALNSLARTLSGYPGRKNLIWVSEGFPFDVLLTNASARSTMK
jgi:VWFA-related protein